MESFTCVSQTSVPNALCDVMIYFYAYIHYSYIITYPKTRKLTGTPTKKLIRSFVYAVSN